MKIFIKFGTFLAIIPNYDFKKKSIIGKRAYRLYSASIVCFLISAICFTTYIDWFLMSKITSVLLYGLTLLLEGNMLVLFAITSLGSAFWNLDRWRCFINYFLCLEKHLNTERCLEKHLLKNIYFQFFLSSTVFVVNYAVLFMNELIALNYTFAPLLVHHACISFLSFAKFTKILVTSNLALAIKCKYQDLNCFLIKGCTGVNAETRNTVRKAFSFYDMMGEIMDNFNKLFGWELLLSVMQTIAMELAIFTNFNDYLFRKRYPIYLPVSTVISVVTLGIMYLVSYMPLFLQAGYGR